MDCEMNDAPYRDPRRSVNERVENLLSLMTVEEKIAQLGSVWGSSCMGNGSFSYEKAFDLLRNGTGHISRIALLLGPRERAEAANAIQRFLIEQTRLGIPAIVHEESCSGYMASEANCFPMPIGLASTFEPALVQKMADVIRRQMRAVGAHQTLAPVVDVVRDARWGRVEETFGEDPYLVSRMGVAYVRGLQTGDLNGGVACTGKHYAGYGFSEGGLNWAPSHIPERELLDVFVAPFAALVAEAKVVSIMNAYQEIDGIPCGASKYLLTDVLRGRLKFEGNVASDYTTLEHLYQTHNIAADEKEAALLGLEAGLDIELPYSKVYGEPLMEAIKKDAIGIELVDRAVRRVLKEKFELGLFEEPFVELDAVMSCYHREEERVLSRDIARKSMVLLKNEDLLPLSSDITSLAVIGPAADSVRLMQGDYHFPTHHEIVYGMIPEDASSRDGAESTQEEMSEIQLAQYLPGMVSVLEGIRSRVSSGTEVLYARGCDISGTETGGIAEAVALAERAAAAVVVVGGRSSLAKGCTSGEFNDAASLSLTGVQQELVERVVATGTPTVVVLINGRPLALPGIAGQVHALLEAWLPGEEGGNAVADILFGVENPAGRLPVSLARDVGQMPLYYNHKPSGGKSMFWGDYSDMPASPLFPFGHGLSYTSFVYADLQLSAEKVSPESILDITLSVQNSGKQAGDEVVQLYLQDVAGSVTRPVKELKGFHRISLEPGESREIIFHLSMSQLAFHGSDMQFAVEPGQMKIMIGASSEDIRLEGSFEITGERRLIEMIDVVPAGVTIK